MFYICRWSLQCRLSQLVTTLRLKETSLYLIDYSCKYRWPLIVAWRSTELKETCDLHRLNEVNICRELFKIFRDIEWTWITGIWPLTSKYMYDRNDYQLVEEFCNCLKEIFTILRLFAESLLPSVDLGSPRGSPRTICSELILNGTSSFNQDYF